jgi:hypothetical protein
LAVPLVVFEDRAPMMMPVPTRAAPSKSCFIGGSPLDMGIYSPKQPHLSAGLNLS